MVLGVVGAIAPWNFPVILAMFNQLSGINAILYYAPRIFEMAGFTHEDAYLQPVYIGGANLLFMDGHTEFVKYPAAAGSQAHWPMTQLSVTQGYF